MESESTLSLAWEIEPLSHVGPIKLDQPVGPVLKILPEPDSITSKSWEKFPGKAYKKYSWYNLPFALSLYVDLSDIVHQVYLHMSHAPTGPKDFSLMLFGTDLGCAQATEIFKIAKGKGYTDRYDSNGFKARNFGLDVWYSWYSLAYNAQKPKGWDDKVDPFIETIWIESPTMVAFGKELEKSEKRQCICPTQPGVPPQSLHVLPKSWKIDPTISAGPITFDMTREQVRAVMPPAPITDDLPEDYDFRLGKDLAIGGDRWIETIKLADGLEKNFEILCRYTKDTLTFHHMEFRFDIDFFETVRLDLFGENLVELDVAQTYRHFESCGGSPHAGSHTLYDTRFLIACFGARPENAVSRKPGEREGCRRTDEFSGIVRFYSGLYAHLFRI